MGAAVLASVIVALLASPAAAKVCSSAGSGEACAGTHGQTYTGALEASLKTSTSATFTFTNSQGGTVGTWTCTSSTIKGSINGGTGAGNISSFTFSSCSSAACPNGVTMSTTAGSTNLWPTQATTGTPPGGTFSIEKIGIHTICGTILGTVPCDFTTAKTSMNLSGGAPAHVTATNWPLTKTAGNEATCGTKADFSGTYVFSSPTTLYLT
jgi:hypothetical protein